MHSQLSFEVTLSSKLDWLQRCEDEYQFKEYFNSNLRSQFNTDHECYNFLSIFNEDNQFNKIDWLCDLGCVSRKFINENAAKCSSELVGKALQKLEVRDIPEILASLSREYEDTKAQHYHDLSIELNKILKKKLDVDTYENVRRILESNLECVPFFIKLYIDLNIDIDPEEKYQQLKLLSLQFPEIAGKACADLSFQRGSEIFFIKLFELPCDDKFVQVFVDRYALIADYDYETKALDKRIKCFLINRNILESNPYFVFYFIESYKKNRFLNFKKLMKESQISRCVLRVLMNHGVLSIEQIKEIWHQVEVQFPDPKVLQPKEKKKCIKPVHLDVSPVQTTSNIGRDSMLALLEAYLNLRTSEKDSRGDIRQHHYSKTFFPCQKSYNQKQAAVEALQQALNGENIDLTIHLPTLRNGRLGQRLRAFIKSGQADDLLGPGQKVKTVTEFIKALEAKNKPHSNRPV